MTLKAISFLTVFKSKLAQKQPKLLDAHAIYSYYAQSFTQKLKGKFIMKQRLFLSVAAILLGGISAAHAQSLTCVVASLGFPAPSGTVVKRAVPSGTCVETPGATGRLRWDDNGSGELELFDTDGGGALLWCAHLHDGNTTCAVGASFCLQSDGNAVIYAGANCTGEALWASNTVGTNVNGEVMEVVDFGGTTGEKAAIINHANTSGPIIVWTSNSSDPS